MRYLEPAEIPLLPLVALVGNDNVAFGAGESGIIIQYMDRDKCLLLEWQDIIRYGIEVLKIPEQPANEPEEIAAPTVDT